MIVYRAVGKTPYNNFGFNPINTIVFEQFSIIKETPCGYWIKSSFKEKRWINKNCRKPFARISKKEAVQDLLYRSKKRAKILKNQLANTESYIKLATDYETY